jgi:hypothetical protein
MKIVVKIYVQAEKDAVIAAALRRRVESTDPITQITCRGRQ